VLLAGLCPYAKGLAALRRARLSISALMAVAVTGAFAIGQWPEAAMVMALYALAEHLEARAVDRARGAIARLLDMAPAQAEVRVESGKSGKSGQGGESGETWRKLPAAQVPPGSVIRAKPGARLALDGTVIQGQSAVNQAPVTGESLPVDKCVGDTVYAGTLNLSGTLLVRVTAAAQDTQLARIIHAVEQAQSERAPMQAFIDRFAAIYTPAVFALALAVALLGPLAAGWPWHESIYKALVLLVIACPCALVIATPATVVSALARAAQLGVLIKGGVYLEQARQLRTVAFDKTGTLTQGQPALAACQSLSDKADEAALHARAHALAAHSDHPVARAIASGLAAQGFAASVDLPDAQDVPGLGVRATVQGQRLCLISPRAAGLAHASESAPESAPEWQAALQAHQAAGRSVSLLARAEGEGSGIGSESGETLTPLALYAVADAIKPEAAAAVQALHQLGVQTVMLSGDHAQAVGAVAQAAGISQAHAELLLIAQAAAHIHMAAEVAVRLVNGLDARQRLAARALRNQIDRAARGALGRHAVEQGRWPLEHFHALQHLGRVAEVGGHARQAVEHHVGHERRQAANRVALVALARSAAGKHRRIIAGDDFAHVARLAVFHEAFGVGDGGKRRFHEVFAAQQAQAGARGHVAARVNGRSGGFLHFHLGQRGRLLRVLCWRCLCCLRRLRRRGRRRQRQGGQQRPFAPRRVGMEWLHVMLLQRERKQPVRAAD